MYGIFMESWVIFKLYGGRWCYLVLYLAALIFVAVKARDKEIRILFAWLPLMMLAVFFFPTFRKVYVKVFGDGNTQYRLLWLVPMGMTVSYAGCLAATLLPMRGNRLGLKRVIDRIVIPVAVALLIAVCGSLVYVNPLVTKAENPWHIPQEAIEVADILAPEQIPGAGRIRVRAAVPSELVHFIRQYSTDIVLAFGRDIIAYDYYNEIHERMEKAEVIDVMGLAEVLRDDGVQYLVLKRDARTDMEPVDAGFVPYAETASYRIFEVPGWDGGQK